MTIRPGIAAATQSFDDYTTHADVINAAAPRWIESRRTFRWWANLPWQLECAGFAQDHHFRAVRLSDLGLTIVPAGGSNAIEWIIPIADINLGDLGFYRALPAPGMSADETPTARASQSGGHLHGCRTGSHAHGSARTSSSTPACRLRDCAPVSHS